MNLMELKNASSELLTDATSMTTVYQEIMNELEILSKSSIILRPSNKEHIQTLIQQITSIKEQINTISNQCSDFIVRYANDSGEILDKLSVGVNKAVDEFVNRISV